MKSSTSRWIPASAIALLDLNFNKEDVKVYLASGYLIFTKPVFSKSNQGTHLGAVFVATADGGDADVLAAAANAQ